MILDKFCSELNSIEADDEQQDDNKPKQSNIDTFENYLEAFGRLIPLKELYLQTKNDKKWFSCVNELIIYHELEMTKWKLKNKHQFYNFFKNNNVLY